MRSWDFLLMRTLMLPSLSFNPDLTMYMHQYLIGVQFFLTQRQLLPSHKAYLKLMIDL